MIWNPKTDIHPDNSALAAYISAEIESVCDQDSMVNDGHIDEIAKAVAHFFKHDPDLCFVDSRKLAILASRALSSLGNGTAARRLLIFGTGLVTPSEWEVSYAGKMLVLDLKQMVVRSDASLELTFFGGLNIIMESICDIWDSSGGQGTLGLRNVCPAAMAFLGDSPRKKDRVTVVDEIKKTCEQKLSQIAEKRAWKHVPRVINLDVKKG
ncbi:hypothetical protein ACFLS1_00765 [Verrucomicrobiota bacterium]